MVDRNDALRTPSPGCCDELTFQHEQQHCPDPRIQQPPCACQAAGMRIALLGEQFHRTRSRHVVVSRGGRNQREKLTTLQPAILQYSFVTVEQNQCLSSHSGGKRYAQSEGTRPTQCASSTTSLASMRFFAKTWRRASPRSPIADSGAMYSNFVAGPP